MTSRHLKSNEYNPYYETYISKAKGLNLKDGFRSNLENVFTFFQSIDVDKHIYRYADGKWTIKEVILHMIDTERIFSYRALRIARHDQTSLPGFDQDLYVGPSKANIRSFESLLDEYRAVRLATITLFDNLDDEMLEQTGTASNSTISVRALGFIILGHEIHHCNILKERYL
ncbi:DinB family protein [Subsaxibacter sp. CAU 1640]|uniref:DinB family protein n=1 Tax=Subsaxibacter sp. CAU 1640 TaxID=2933271 RepID=UPI002005F962|nr:DinB family protein [Subsaxibacter sp. CAU 1640]MCK7591047.1 DinB family protein [Subsaxibacter sp. CAU 1640]